MSTVQHLIVMGVSGSGKTTIAERLATELNWTFAEGDNFHPQANIDTMAAGVPLSDADRAPWLRAVRDWMSSQAAAGLSTVITCSALRRSYRELLREADGRVCCIHLSGDMELITDRLQRRSGHFMPPDLLPSQYETLEPLAADEDGMTIDISAEPSTVTRLILDRMSERPPDQPATP